MLLSNNAYLLTAISAFLLTSSANSALKSTDDFVDIFFYLQVHLIKIKTIIFAKSINVQTSNSFFVVKVSPAVLASANFRSLTRDISINRKYLNHPNNP